MAGALLGEEVGELQRLAGLALNRLKFRADRLATAAAVEAIIVVEKCLPRFEAENETVRSPRLRDLVG